MTDTQITVPPFYCPIPPAVQGQFHELADSSMEWAQRIGICPDQHHQARVLASASAEFAARTAPHGSTDRLRVYADFVHWAFAFDDVRCDGKDLTELVPLVARLLRMLEGVNHRLCGDDPFLIALHDIAVRFRDCATPVQFRRWLEAHRQWLFGVVQINAGSRQDHTLPLEQYLIARFHDGGGPVVTTMMEAMELGPGRDVPGHEMDSPAVRALTEACWTIAIWDNDRISRYKEIRGRTDRCNLVDVLMHAHGWSPHRALQEVVALRDRALRQFLELRERQLSKASPELRDYLTGLGHVIRGNIDWSLSVARYNTVFDPEDWSVVEKLAIGARVIEQQDLEERSAPTMPSIAWWWDPET
ncbi:hypothetical protein SAMN05216188_10839 [Lentzea xinjiangensis]|uniref:Terpene synthase n=1 Tax=Lentzea xinjiangensis TaxID=402600 RepID=A0A1H9LPG3_9PSEU|nr:hypothetical protein [Lentzea xinjiangensis]SER13381.1 hypothetical protein SAMN05216188_10839 [Lentzea xinjiangensis]